MNPVTMEEMPNLVLSNIFSWLDFQSLVKANRVCRRWRGLIEAGEAWQEFRETHTGELPPYRGSLGERCRVLRNWRCGIGEVAELPGSAHVRFAVLEDNTIIEVLFEIKSEGVWATVRNIATKKIIGSVEIQNSRGAPLVAIVLRGTALTMLDEAGLISRFDIRTCARISRIQGGVVAGISGAITAVNCTDQELLIAHGQNISIWDVKTGGVKTIEVSGHGRIDDIVSTPHFIVFAAQYGNGAFRRVFSLRKSDQKEEMLEDGAFVFMTGSSSGYCAFLETASGRIKIYEDVSEQELKLIHNCVSFPTPSNHWCGDICIYKNWLVVARNKSLLVWDLKARKEVSSITLQGGRVNQLATNGETLCALSYYQGDTLAAPYIPRYYLYNFARDLAKVGEPKEPPKSLQERLCVIQ